MGGKAVPDMREVARMRVGRFVYLWWRAAWGALQCTVKITRLHVIALVQYRCIMQWNSSQLSESRMRMGGCETYSTSLVKFRRRTIAVTRLLKVVPKTPPTAGHDVLPKMVTS